MQVTNPVSAGAATGHMGPINAAVRGVSEIVALYGVTAGIWNWTHSVVATIVVPVAAMALWGVLRVPDDPGPALVAVPGLVRLAIEIGVFGGGAAGLRVVQGAPVGVVFAAIVSIHDGTTFERLRFVLSSERRHR